MASESNQYYLDAAFLAYGEYYFNGLETSPVSSPSENQLINDQDTYIAQAGLSGWTPISVDYIPADGFYGVAYQLPDGDVVISYEGTVDDAPSIYCISSIQDDTEIWRDQTPKAFTDAETFAANVIAYATSTLGLGTTTDRISLTGHSLGGAEAEYVSANLGLGGVAFGAPGLPGYSNANKSSSFVTYVDYGDPVGNYASNMPYYVAPNFTPFSGQDHVGAVKMTGATLNAVELAEAAVVAKTPLFAISFLQYHALTHYAADLQLVPPGGASIGTLAATQQAGISLDPNSILASLDASLGAPGQSDFESASVVSDSKIESPDFTISVDNDNYTATITQKQALVGNPGTAPSPAGTDVIQFNQTDYAIFCETFTEDGGSVYGFVPDVDGNIENETAELLPSEILFIQDPGSFQGTISDFQVGNVIDLIGIIASAVTLTSTQLFVQESDGTTLTFVVSNSAEPQTVYAVSDGDGGTDLTLTEPVPVTTAPTSLAATAGVAQALVGLNVAVPGSLSNSNETLTVVLSAGLGVLTAGAGRGTVSGSGSPTLTITGSLDDINYDLSSVRYTEDIAGRDLIDVGTTNDQGEGDGHQIPVITSQPPPTGYSINQYDYFIPQSSTIYVGYYPGMNAAGLLDVTGSGTFQQIDVGESISGQVSVSGNLRYGYAVVGETSPGQITINGGMANGIESNSYLDLGVYHSSAGNLVLENGGALNQGGDAINIAIGSIELLSGSTLNAYTIDFQELQNNPSSVTTNTLLVSGNSVLNVAYVDHFSGGGGPGDFNPISFVVEDSTINSVGFEVGDSSSSTIQDSVVSAESLLVDNNSSLVFNNSAFQQTGAVSLSSLFADSPGISAIEQSSVEISGAQNSFSGTADVDDTSTFRIDSGSQVTVYGSSTFQGNVENDGTIELSSGTMEIDGTLTGSGSISCSGNSRLAFGLSSSTANSISNFAVGDAIAIYSGDVQFQSYDAAISTLSITGEVFEDSDYSQEVLSLHMIGNYQPGDFIISDQEVMIACYAKGTAIGTSQGETFVEDLQIGELVRTYAGKLRPVRWIGRRSYAGRFLAANRNVQPVCFRKGALGSGLPYRDLYVSPEHAMFLNGVLVPARCLVNGTTITQVYDRRRVEYFHVELDTHDVILAEGAASETFLDDGSRGMFENALGYKAHPTVRRDRQFFAPRIGDGFELEAIRCGLNRARDRQLAAA